MQLAMPNSVDVPGEIAVFWRKMEEEGICERWQVTSGGRYWEGRRDDITWVILQSRCDILSNKWKKYKLLFNWKIMKIKLTFVLRRVISVYVCFFCMKTTSSSNLLFRTDFMKISYYMLRILLYPNMQYGFYSFLVSSRFFLYYSCNCAHW